MIKYFVSKNALIYEDICSSDGEVLPISFMDRNSNEVHCMDVSVSVLLGGRMGNLG